MPSYSYWGVLGRLCPLLQVWWHWSIINSLCWLDASSALITSSSQMVIYESKVLCHIAYHVICMFEWVKAVESGYTILVLLFQVYAWGANNYGQLGHSESGISPSRIKVQKTHTSFVFWGNETGLSVSQSVDLIGKEELADHWTAKKLKSYILWDSSV